MYMKQSLHIPSTFLLAVQSVFFLICRIFLEEAVFHRKKMAQPLSRAIFPFITIAPCPISCSFTSDTAFCLPEINIRAASSLRRHYNISGVPAKQWSHTDQGVLIPPVPRLGFDRLFRSQPPPPLYVCRIERKSYLLNILWILPT